MNALLKNLLSIHAIEYITLDQDLHVVEVSSGVQSFADGSHQFVKGQPCCLGLPELIGLDAGLKAVLQGQPFDLKAIARSNPTGAVVYFDYYAIALNEPEFPTSRLILFIENVTKRMNLEQSLVQASNEMGSLLSSLKKSKDYTDKIITSMADALLVTNAAGIIKTINQATQDLLGYSEAELLDQPFSMIVADKNFLPQAIQPQPNSPDKSLTDLEVICRAKSGEKVSIAFSCSAIQTEFEAVQDFIYVGRDISERERSQQRLMMQYTTAGILSEENTLASAVTKILPALCQSLEWDVAELWLPEATRLTNGSSSPQTQLASSIISTPRDACLNASQLRCVEIWSKSPATIADFITLTQQTTFALGVGTPGCIWATSSPRWVEAVVDDMDFVRANAAAQAGLHSLFGFPIQSGNETLGVVMFFSRELKQLDPILLQTMMAIGKQMGQFIQRKRAEAALHREQKRTDHLLRNILPQPIVDLLKQEQTEMKRNGNTWSGIAEHFDEATVLFADLVNFTQMTSCLSPIRLVNVLNQIFSAFDRLSDLHKLEKIKTIGDAYMVVGGVPQRRADHAQAIAEMALDMRVALAKLNLEHSGGFKMRVGIHTGPVVAGVIGIKKFTYDLWGDTVNTANRMESHGIAGQIQVTETTYEHLKDRYMFLERGQIPIKGKGEMNTYLLVGRID